MIYSTTSDSEAICYNSEDSNEEENCPGNLHGDLTIVERMANIKIKTNCSLTTIAAFAQLLRDIGHDVPKDARTIMKTKVHNRTNQLNSNNFVHLGLTEGLKKKIVAGDKKLAELILQFNIDGLPLWRSSRTQFWPIICRIINAEDGSEFMVSLHCGEGKPTSLKAFLAPFLTELKNLLENGIHHLGKQFAVKISAFCCDAPARAFIKQIIGHMGYCACERCETYGIRSQGRTLFPYLEAPLRYFQNNNVKGLNNCFNCFRTDESFRAGSDDHHHNSISPLEDIESLDMIFDFPLDYLHLVCLGVMKRLLKLIWMKQHPDCLSKQQQRLVDDLIRLCSLQLPKEFNRKGRSLDDISYWKATEFRTFLLYTGVFILKNVLPENQYKHFIYFHVAIRILCNPNATREQIIFAGDALKHFVTNFSVLYGDLHIVYNVYSLIHLAIDVLVHGPLDSFSCFGFESYLGKIKKLLRNSRLPLKQIVRRLSEIDAMQSALNRSGLARKSASKSSTSFESIIPNSKNDCYIVVPRRAPLIIKVTAMDAVSVTGYSFKIDKLRDGAFNEFYRIPVDSSDLNIFQVRGFHRKKRWNKIEISNCMKAVFLRKNVKVQNGLIIPLLHLSSQ